VVTVVVSAVVLGPMLVSGGIALRGDMVFVPDQPWKSGWLGLDGSVPRAVPMDALVSLADEVLPGAVLQRLLLAAGLLLGGFGVARIAHRFVALAQVAAVLVYLWNPWVHERLEIGQWPTVLGYGLLPWLVLAAMRVRDGGERGWTHLTLVLAATAVCAPSVGLLGVVVAGAVVLAGEVRSRCWAVAGLGAIVNLPWIVPSLLGPSLRGNDLGFDLFAARGESSLGTVASLLSMGGIWKTSVVAPERTNVLVVSAAGVLALVVLASFRYAVPALGSRTATTLAAIGGSAFLVALLPSVGPVGRALGDLSEQVPAVAILRDSQRFLAPFGLVLALGCAALVHRLVATREDARGSADRSGRLISAWLLVVAPVVLLPSMTWGLRGDLHPVHYPSEWSQVADTVAADPGPVVVVPWAGSYRGFDWNDNRAVLDPAPRFLPGTVLIDDRIYLPAGTVPSEDPSLVRVRRALEVPDPSAGLRQLGVRWVLVEKGNAETMLPPPLSGRIAHDGRDLLLVELVDGKTVGEFSRHKPPVWLVSLADATAASAVVISIWHAMRRKPRKSRKQM